MIQRDDSFEMKFIGTVLSRNDCVNLLSFVKINYLETVRVKKVYKLGQNMATFRFK